MGNGSDQALSNKDFCLDLRGLQNLRVLKMDINHFRTFMNGVDFPASLRKISLGLIDHEQPDSLKEIFHHREDRDGRDLVSSENSKILSSFFEKWKKLKDLKVLDLCFHIFSEADPLLKNFILPLLRATPKLETFNCRFLSRNKKMLQAYSMSFDLEAFLYGIKPLQSLKTIKIDADKHYNCLFTGLASPPQQFFCLPNLSSIELDIKINSDFDFKKFFNVFLCIDNPETMKNSFLNKQIKLPRIYLFCVEDFIRFLDSIHLFSHFESLQAHFQTYLIVENIDDIYSNFKSPIGGVRNVCLAVNIYLKSFEAGELTQEQEQFFRIVFGRLKFSVNKANKLKSDLSLFFPDDFHPTLLKSDEFPCDKKYH